MNDSLHIGGCRPLDGSGTTLALDIPLHHLTTHGVVVGMTGSGKTGMLMVLVEEALRSGVPVLMIDVKGDLPNLLLTFPALDGQEFAPWVDDRAAHRAGVSTEELASDTAARWREGLAKWELTADDVAAFRAKTEVRVITPGTNAGEMLHVLSALEIPSPLWSSDVEAARESLSASISLLLRLIGRDPDPTRSRDHVVLSVLAERRLRAGEKADVASLLRDLADPPIESIGAMQLDEFLPRREHNALATALNTLLASPTFETWRQGVPLDVDSWLRVKDDGKVPAVIVSVAHLDQDERALVLGVLLEEVLAWVRTQKGTSDLRGLVVFDEVYGYLPPHPSNPPTKRPMIELMKQARAFGVGVVVATQNPMDVDYRALSNAGLWMVGRLQTDADRERVLEGLMGSDGAVNIDGSELAACVKQLAPRWFVMRDVHREPSVVLATSRTTLCWLRGPMTRAEIRGARGTR